MIKKYFSQLTKKQKLLPKKQIEQINFKKEKLLENKVYEGMNDVNTNELKKKEAYNHFFPKQHPKMLNNEDTSIISHLPKPMNLTDYNRIPPSICEFDPPKFESPIDSKELDIGILGPPNAGKSSIFNNLIGQRISAVSSKAGTTYDKLEGIDTDIDQRVQLVFYDTPGATKITNSIRSRRIITKAWNIIPQCDKILFVVDSAKHLDIVTRESMQRLLSNKMKPSLINMIRRFKAIKAEELTLDEIDKIKAEVSSKDKLDYEPQHLSTILVMNKVDLVTNKRKMKLLENELNEIGSFDKIFYTSVKTGYGMKALQDYLKEQSLRRPWRYHPEIKSTQTEKEKCEEILKSLLFDRFYKEFPYQSLVQMISYVPYNNGEIKMNFQVEVRYNVQVGMFLGEHGRIVKELRQELDKELTYKYQLPVKTNIFVVERRRGIPSGAINDTQNVSI